MKKILPLALFILCYWVQAQYTVSGTFSPAKDYSWLIAYRLKSGTQAYVADTSINDGKFSLKIPENAEPGTYRLVYAVPQEKFYFDIIYNRKEGIELAFETDRGAEFKTSQENILFSTYFDEISEVERQLINFYASEKKDEAQFLKLTRGLKNVQQSYEKRGAFRDEACPFRSGG